MKWVFGRSAFEMQQRKLSKKRENHFIAFGDLFPSLIGVDQLIAYVYMFISNILH